MSLGIFHQKLACVWVKPSQGHHFRQKVARRCHLRFWKSDSAEHLAMMRGKQKIKRRIFSQQNTHLSILLTKNSFPFQYADTGGYNITPLGATGPSDPHNIYATAASNHPPDPQQMSALNFFAGAATGSQVVGGYPATPAALMPLLGGGDQDSEQLKQQKELIYG